MASPDRNRCGWCVGDTVDTIYHDSEWGVPVRDDRTLFEFILLEGAQAGLSWRTILHKREGYRQTFADFDPAVVAEFDDDKLESLRNFDGIVRNRAKIKSARGNARAFLELQSNFGSFADYLWGFVDGQPVINHFDSLRDVPAETELSRTLSRDLRKKGFRFVGPTICYAYLQATGLVMDHLTGCFRHSELAGT